ncbi:hypothetical protein [Massilia sp. TSP1-1-2]|uniref:hypothetical protein n=1 Tax=Massilia sp. TSP1-1-2 TaxID=2804649 RepID=UPI003CF17271
MNCEFCAALTGRFDANRECCRIRLLAGAPNHSRQEVYARVKKGVGEQAATELRNKVNAEYKRQQDCKAAIVRAQHDRATAKGRQEAAALLNKMKESNMNVSPVREFA